MNNDDLNLHSMIKLVYQIYNNCYSLARVWAACDLIEVTEYLTLFGFAMLLMEYKPAFQFKKVFKNAKFGQCGPHLL